MDAAARSAPTEAPASAVVAFARDLRRYLLVALARSPDVAREPFPRLDLSALRSWRGWSAEAAALLGSIRGQPGLERLLADPRVAQARRWFARCRERVRREALEELSDLRSWAAARMRDAPSARFSRQRPA